MRGITSRWVPRSELKTEGALLERVLAARGLTDAATRAEFLDPVGADFDSPGNLPGVDAAVDRLLAAIQGGERICIYGDYDVDGVTSVATLIRVLRAIAPDVQVDSYIPDRRAEGFGLNPDAIRSLRAGGIDLLVTVDCGVSAEPSHAVCREIGLDLIITDHHPLGSHAMPDVVAVVHPGLPGSSYPWPILSGSAVAWKLARHLVARFEGSEDPSPALKRVLMDTLCLAGMGVIADVVPLVGENRRFAAKALRLMRSCTIPGVAALLLECVKKDESLDSETIGFRIGPRINAAGRMKHAQQALDLLLTDDDAEARAGARALTEINTHRQELVKETIASACTLVEAKGMDQDDKRMIVLADDAWHPGVVGIVAARLKDQYHRPAVLFGPAGHDQPDLYRGSARSIGEFAVSKAFDACSQFFQSHGGHAVAAGGSVATDRISEVTEALLEYAAANLPVEHLTPAVRYDCEVTPADLKYAEVAALDAIRPYGKGNPTPQLLIRGLTIEQARPVGRGDHLQLRFRGARGIWFRYPKGTDADPERLPRGATVDVIAEVKVDSWKSVRYVDLLVKDLRRQ